MALYAMSASVRCMLYHNSDTYYIERKPPLQGGASGGLSFIDGQPHL